MNEHLEDQEAKTSVDNSLEERWQRAIDIAPAILKGHDPSVSPDKLAEEQKAIESTIRDLADSRALKVVAYLSEDGKEHRTIEPDWSETNGFGLPVDVFAGVMGLDTPHIYEYGDLAGEGLLGKLADVAQKPVSAIVNGQYIEPVAPEVSQPR